MKRILFASFSFTFCITACDPVEISRYQYNQRNESLIQQLPDEQREAVEALHELGFRVDVEHWIVDFHTAEVSNQDLVHLKKLPKIRVIQASRSGISDLKHFRDLKYVESIWLTSTDIDDDDLRHLSELESLKYLHISLCPRVTDKGLRHLRYLPNLQTLDISQTGVTDSGLPQLATLKNLGLLYVANTNDITLNSPGKRELEAALPGITIITQMSR